MSASRQEKSNSNGVCDDCHCNDEEERYLMRKKADTMEESGAEEDDDEAFHVLITRPEIATRPRDNIIFEGDMDLKTTFETSYEALAKMRLDYWKKSQSTKKPKEGAIPRKQRAKKSLSQGKNDQNGNNEVSVLPKEPHPDLRASGTRAVDDRKTSTSTFMPNDANRHESRASNETDIVRGGGEVAKEARNLVDRTTQTPEPFELDGDDAIDSDLRPLIVYNANMNRLDKVGLRKRSKYRPSTTLRSGTRGLFGDHEVVESYHNQNHKANTPTLKMPNESAKVNFINAASSSEQRKDNERGRDSRNLMHSQQKNHLVYSEKNLPVDSKRKVLDNINMVDHIRQHNIVDESLKFALPAEESGIINFYNRALNSDEIQVARAEEEAAYEEIRRVQQVSTTGDFKDGETNSSASRNGNLQDRHSRLQRTCQNQNFDIFQCQYPELKSEPMSSRSNFKTTKPEKISNKNLFRESPDFILTTGRAVTNKEVKREAESFNDSMLEFTTGEYIDPHTTNDYGVQPESLCRVLNLDNEFQYVGSLSGHKYFTEREYIQRN